MTSTCPSRLDIPHRAGCSPRSWRAYVCFQSLPRRGIFNRPLQQSSVCVFAGCARLVDRLLDPENGFRNANKAYREFPAIESIRGSCRNDLVLIPFDDWIHSWAVESAHLVFADLLNGVREALHAISVACNSRSVVRVADTIAGESTRSIYIRVIAAARTIKECFPCKHDLCNGSRQEKMPDIQACYDRERNKP
jgi:hypothetical protein